MIIINTQFLKQDSFNFFITSVLRQIAIKEHSDIEFNAYFPKDISNKKEYERIEFDAISNRGFLGLSGPLVFEIKYFSKPFDPNKILLGLGNKIEKSQLHVDVTIVLITNQICNHFSNKSYNSESNIKFVIWDNSYIQSWIAKFPIDASNAISQFEKPTPKSAEFTDISESDFLYKSNNNLEEIKRIIRSTDNFAFVLGTGVSIDPGAKSWNDLLKYFEDKLNSNGIVNDSKKLGKKIGDSNIITAQLIKELYPIKADYFWEIHQALYENRVNPDPNFALSHIVEIIKKCEHMSRFRILTYNFDNYLESYLDDQGITYYNTLYDSGCSVDDRISIYHVHGFLPYVHYKSHILERYQKSIYLAEEDYNNLYNNPCSWQISSQLSFFRENMCLFIGCSLADLNIRHLLEMTGKEHKRHFAILTRDKMTNNDLLRASNHFSRLGIEVIWAENFHDIRQMLKDLCISI